MNPICRSRLEQKLPSAAYAVQLGRIARMTGERMRVGGADLAVFRIEGDSPPSAPLLIWAHGWGQTHQALLPIAEAMRRRAPSILFDLPGFGASPLPPAAWSTADYADAAAEFLSQLPAGRRLWIGHSFGARIGLQLAARHPALLAGLVLIAAAGLPPRRSLGARASRAMRRWSFRLARAFVPEGAARERLRQRFGSADYRSADAGLRPILVKAVSENLASVARMVRCPTLLLFGHQDRETPPEIGERFAALIPQSRLVVLRGFDHWTVLTEARHQIVQRLDEFMEQLT